MTLAQFFKFHRIFIFLHMFRYLLLFLKNSFSSFSKKIKFPPKSYSKSFELTNSKPFRK